MIQQELIVYIKAESSRGVSKEQIKHALLSSGWSESDIDEAMAITIDHTSLGVKKSYKMILSLTVILILVGAAGAYWYFTKTTPATSDITARNTIENRNQDSGAKLFNKEIKSVPAIGADSIFVLSIFSKDRKIDWKTILTVSTISKISPVLLVENSDKPDDFSTKLFIDQYSPKKIYTHNYQYNGQNVEVLSPENLNATLYSSSNFVVIANGEDYASSLTAASFAARFNIPIFFTPLKNSDKDLISRWKAQSIGIGISADIDHSLTETEANDLLKKDSDYLILTTSDDLEKNSHPGFSLAAPILAGGRDGVVLNVKKPNRESIKQAVAQITKNSFNPTYIVAVGNERNFPYLEFDKVPLGTLYNQDDDHQYFVNLYYWADYNKSNEYIPDASVGVITGYSVSDASSLIARSLFYEKIAKSNKVVAWSPYSSSDSALLQGNSRVDQVLDNDFTKKYVSNFKNFNYLADKTSVITELKDSSIFVYSGHSWRNILGNISITEMPVFNNPTFIFAFGCATLQPWNPGTPEFNRNAPIIGYEAIKNGAVGFLGSAEVSFVASELYFGSEQRILVQNAFTLPIGHAQFITSRMSDSYFLYTIGKQNPEGSNYYYKSYTYLVGDPKLKLKVDSNLTPNVISGDNIRMDFESKSRPEKFVSIKDDKLDYVVMCSYDEKECADLLKDRPRDTTQFSFPILLDNYVYSVDLAFESNDSPHVHGRTQLRFFTENPVKNISTKTETNLSPDAAYKFIGKYCFNFDKKQYCPNLLLYLLYGSVNTQTKAVQIPKYIDINFVF